jgi:hypothetical protein
VIARLAVSLEPDPNEPGYVRQEVDIRYVVTSLAGDSRRPFEEVHCKRGQMENLIKWHKAQLASDPTSCHSATANQVRLVLHTAAFWFLHAVCCAVPEPHPLADAEFVSIRERLLKIGTRVIGTWPACASISQRVVQSAHCSVLLRSKARDQASF